MGFTEKTNYLLETKSLLKDRINSLGGSITSGTTFRDYLVWLDSLYEALDEMTITGLPDSLEGKCEQEGTPTPTSPQPINITTGRQVVRVSDGTTTNDYEINLGKNLANIENIQIGKSWSNVANTNRATILFIPVEKNQQYSLVSSYTNQSITQIRGVLNKGPNDQVSSLVVNGTFKNDSNWTYMSIEVIANTTFTSSMLDGVKIMLCKGTATINDYAPYKTPIYLGEIGNYKDYIFRNTTENPLYDSNLEEGQWYIHKEIGRVVVNGTEDGWALRTNTSPSYIKFRNDNLFPSNVKERLQLISNYFVANGGANDAGYSGNAICGNVGQYAKWLHVSIDNSIVSDLATFKTWLGTHNVSIYYILNTPTNTLIEDEELINQLNEIDIFTVISEDFYN